MGQVNERDLDDKHNTGAGETMNPFGIPIPQARTVYDPLLKYPLFP